MKEQLLRSQNNLVISGLGVIVLGAWTFLKGIMLIVVGSTETIAAFSTLRQKIVFIIILIFIAILLIGGSFLIRIYIGRAAAAEARGESRGNKYIILSVFLAVFNCAAIIVNIINLPNTGRALPESVAVLLVDISMVYNLLSVAYSAVKYRKLVKVQEEG